MDRVSTDKLMQDLQAVVEDAEDLLKATANQAGEKITAARARAEESVRAAKARMAAAGHEVAERSRAAAHATDHYVHENPWTSIGVAAGVGFLIGLLIGRR
ncbi:MAG TPA: DUF883 family protein [Burkholderiales bacterium]|nr:DUF883 family protein [Burkholderiales bacterium]